MIEKATYKYGPVFAKQIYSDPAYQRTVDPERIKQIASHFDPLKVNAVKVSHRDGKYFVFDGQHTLKVLCMRNGTNDFPVMCKIYEGLTQADEAELFARQNEFEKRVEKIAEMKALYTAGDPEIVELKKTIESVGFIFDFSKAVSQNRIVCCQQVYKIFTRTRVKDFINLLTVIKEAWNGSPESLRKEIIGGMWVLFNTYKSNIDMELAVKKFQLVNPIEVIRDGKALKHIPGDAKYSYILATYYNKNQRRNKLDLSRLTQ